MIEEEYKNQNYKVARACYKKLMFLLLKSEENYFDYEDIVGKLRFENFLSEYFMCLIKTCSIKELFEEYIEYLRVKEEYYFESVHKTIFSNLLEDRLKVFKNLVEKEAEGIKEEEYWMYDLIGFLLDLARFRKDRAEFDRLCDKYNGFVDEDEPFNEDD